jgi:hypothetical protein
VSLVAACSRADGSVSEDETWKITGAFGIVRALLTASIMAL